jgi:CubicO group peptidase (beta-lactamase class C family)
VLNGVIIFSGKTYLYKGIKETYLQGKKGPGIYDSLVFANREIRRSNRPLRLQNSKEKIELSAKQLSVLEKDETTSFLVLKDGKIVVERYWENHTVNTHSNSFSMAKSVLGTLVGIAKDQGIIESFDDPISKYIDFYSDEKRVTIRHLLTMSSDLKWRESGSNPFSENAEAYYGRDLVRLMKKLKFGDAPNDHFYYASGNSQILGYILEMASGKRISAYFEENIWSKVGTENNAFWSLDQKEGMEKTFCCLYATTRDYSKLGQLWLQRGVWNGDTIIQPETLEELFSFAQLNNGSKNLRYGMHFWILDHPKERIVYARGILGQYIIVFPESNCVVVRTGHERKEKYKIPQDKLHDEAFINENKYKVDHPLDLFEYVKIVHDLMESE